MITDSKDVFGEGVNISSRLQAVAEPGGIYLSEDIQHLIRSHRDMELRYVGALTLKNVATPVRTYAVQGQGFPKVKDHRPALTRPRTIIIALVLLIAGIYGGFRIYIALIPSHQINSIAVMPFDNLSANPEEDYFAMGMTHALAANLGKVSALKLSGYTSAERLKNASASIREIGRELNVDAIVRGAVLREGNMVRITAQLIDSHTEELIWIESYDRDIVSILRLQSEVASAIVNEISVITSPTERQLLSEAPLVNAEAYDLLLKGLFHIYKVNNEHYEIAVSYLNKALEIDPENAKAYAGIGLAWIHRGQWGGMDPTQSGEEAKSFALNALRIDEKLPLGHLVIAHYYTAYSWDWDFAVQEFEKTISLDRNSPEPRLFYADLLVSLHENQKALQQIDTAMMLDPLNAFSHCVKGWVLLAIGKDDDAIIALQKSLELEPGLALSHRCLWTIFHGKKNYPQAIRHAIDFYAAQNYQQVASNLEQGYQNRDYLNALKFAADELVKSSIDMNIQGMRVARLYTFANEKDLALTWLEKAYQQYYPSFFSLNVDPHWASLHNEPRFKKLVQQMNLTIGI